MAELALKEGRTPFLRKIYELCGDDIGDLEMIENCGEGVLMLNSNIFEKYPNILKTEYSNNEDGVCKYLDKKFKISAKPH